MRSLNRGFRALLTAAFLLLGCVAQLTAQTQPARRFQVGWLTEQAPAAAPHFTTPQLAPQSIAPNAPPYGTRMLPSQGAQEQFLDGPTNGTFAAAGPTKEQIARMMLPQAGGAFEWLPESSNIELTTMDASVKIATYPFFGPPPPMLNFNYSLTTLNSPAALALPDRLHDYAFGASWVRPVNEQWTWRFMANMGYASDGRNTSSDAWQFRGGFFAMYRASEEWSWVFGALALGRRDLPAVPAIGATWTPNEAVKVDLLMPRPRVSLLLADDGVRQQWSYLGLGLSGGTWAVERMSVDDQLTYRDWRLVWGWQSVPKPPPGVPFARGRKLTIEGGYVFAREIEFERGAPSIPLDDTFVLRTVVSF